MHTPDSIDTRIQRAFERIDAVHHEDPTTEVVDGRELSAEWLYSERMLEILKLVEPNATPALQLAAKCQHIGRWKLPRDTYPMDKKGYYQWRAAIMAHQLAITTAQLADAGIDDQLIADVVDALKNKSDKNNPHAVIIEDTACLVFIKWYLAGFIGRFDTDKAKNILIRTASKMSAHGLSLIPLLNLDEEVAGILKLLND